MFKNREGIHFGYKDSWDIDMSLSPIILSSLQNFKKVILDKGVNKCPSELFVDTGDYDGDCDRCHIEFMKILDKMIYSFDRSNIPDIMKYDFEYLPNEDHGRYYTDPAYRIWSMSPSNQSESDRYKSDVAIHKEKVKEGYLLFGTYYHTLWW